MDLNYFFVDNPSGEYRTDEDPISVNCSGLVDRTGDFLIASKAGRCDYTVYYLYEGALTVQLGNEPEKTLQSGAVLAVPPGVPFYYLHQKGEAIRYYWVHFTGSHAAELWDQFGLPREGLWQPLSVSELALVAFRRLTEEMKNPPDAITRQCAAAAMTLMLAELVRLINDTRSCRRLERSFNYLQEHFTEPIAISTLAGLEQLGPSRYHQLFRAQIGCSPNQYITRLRMSLAKKLLADSSEPISRVAAACGYEDEFYFSRVFRRECGVSPSIYRKQ
ncbi:MAG: helix-turn-helix transcriptional regulator [Clostridia bacterium]|nr:helix-turn-helix transcriptional regulator [Clostridia bacterium]